VRGVLATYGREGGDRVREVGAIKVFLGVVDCHAAFDIRCVFAFVT
jgi:hypothetical protein